MGADFFRDKNVKGEKGRTRNYKKQFKIEKDYFTHSCQKKTREQKKKETWQKEKKQKMSSTNCWMKNDIFSDTSNRQAKKRKLEKPFFKTQKTRQNKKNKCKTCPTKKETDNKFFFW